MYAVYIQYTTTGEYLQLQVELVMEKVLDQSWTLGKCCFTITKLCCASTTVQVVLLIVIRSRVVTVVRNNNCTTEIIVA